MSACTDKNSDPNPVELKTYTVKADKADALRMSLASLLGAKDGETSFGNVKIVDDQLVVIARRSMQGDIKSLIERVNNKEGVNTSKTIKSNVMVVIGSDTEDKKLTVVVPEVEEALRTQGFTEKYLYIYDSLTTRAIEAHEVSIKSDFLQGDTKYMIDKDKIMLSADLRSYDRSVELKTRVVLKPDQYFVLTGMKANIKKDRNMADYERRSIAIVTKSTIE